MRNESRCWKWSPFQGLRLPFPRKIFWNSIWRLSACKISRLPLTVNEKKKKITAFHLEKHYLLQQGALQSELFQMCSCMPNNNHAQVGAAEGIPAVTSLSSQGYSLHPYLQPDRRILTESLSPLFILALGIITFCAHRFSYKERMIIPPEVV